jgi:predicted nucleic-acid-binding Zn-ribbon protein
MHFNNKGLDHFLNTLSDDIKNKYDLSKIIWINSGNKIEIICKDHGSFFILPHNLKKGGGCPECAKIKRTSPRKQPYYTIEEVKTELQQIFGDTVGYDLVSNNLLQITLICPKHSSFTKHIRHLRAGKGCVKCNKKENMRKDVPVKTISDYIPVDVDTNLILDNIEFKGWGKKLKIECRIHGIITLLPGDIKRGCPKCRTDAYQKTRLMSVETFIERANIVHENKYDYSHLTEFTSGKIQIKCPEHGFFLQRSSSHLAGRGCSKCAKQGTSGKEQQWLKSLNIDQELWHTTININNKIYKTDAYDPKTNTIYEYYGRFWHGNPDDPESSKINNLLKKPLSELYQKTLIREQELKNAGYKIINYWGE